MADNVSLPNDLRGIAPAKLDELREKHKRVRYVEGPDGEPAEWAAVLIVPPLASLKMYKHQLHDPAQRPEAQETIFKKMAVACWTLWDGECDVDTLLSRFGLAPEGCSDAISALTGLKAQERVKA